MRRRLIAGAPSHKVRARPHQQLPVDRYTGEPVVPRPLAWDALMAALNLAPAPVSAPLP